MAEITEVKEVKDQYIDELMAKPNVIGVGAGLKEINGQHIDQLSIVTLVTQKQPENELTLQERVPGMLDGIPTDVVEVGEVRALAQMWQAANAAGGLGYGDRSLNGRARRLRPAPPGVSIGHASVTSGTFGCVVRDRKFGTRLILSNNHVLADCNAARSGDAILQPGPSGGGMPGADTLGFLVRFCPLRFVGEPEAAASANAWLRFRRWLARLFRNQEWQAELAKPAPAAGNNLVDAAVARPVNQADILDEILEIGIIQGSMLPLPGMTVRKSGRSTGLSEGMVTVVDTTMTVNYGVGRTAIFDHQVLTTPMSSYGDSGALLVKADAPLALGLLFAGSDKVTIYNPIQAVLDCLEVRL
jgi:hypothetical protein